MGIRDKLTRSSPHLGLDRVGDPNDDGHCLPLCFVIARGAMLIAIGIVFNMILLGTLFKPSPAPAQLAPCRCAESAPDLRRPERIARNRARVSLQPHKRVLTPDEFGDALEKLDERQLHEIAEMMSRMVEGAVNSSGADAGAESGATWCPVIMPGRQ
jgi:hypothetical protein